MDWTDYYFSFSGYICFHVVRVRDSQCSNSIDGNISGVLSDQRTGLPFDWLVTSWQDFCCSFLALFGWGGVKM